jgi:hypothetical protein
VAQKRQQRDTDPDQVVPLESAGAARDKQQEHAREAKLERFAHVTAVRPEPAVRPAVNGVEAASGDDLIDPGDQTQNREYNCRAHQPSMRHAREHQAWRMKVGGRAMRSPPHAATEAQNSKKRDRLRMVEVSLPKAAGRRAGRMPCRPGKS